MEKLFKLKEHNTTVKNRSDGRYYHISYHGVYTRS